MVKIGSKFSNSRRGEGTPANSRQHYMTVCQRKSRVGDKRLKKGNKEFFDMEIDLDGFFGHFTINFNEILFKFLF